jgi:hypothetical protein
MQYVATVCVGRDAGSISVQCVAKLSVRRNEWSLSMQCVATVCAGRDAGSISL